MIQTILRPNFSRECSKNYFSSYENMQKTAVLERKCLTWQESLEYLRIYWNANDVSAMGRLTKKELRPQFLGNSSKIIKLYSYMNTLLWQQTQTLYVKNMDKYVQTVLRLKMLDRKMRIWSVEVYTCFEKADDKFLLSKCELINMRHIRHKSTMAECEALAIVTLKDKKHDFDTALPKCPEVNELEENVADRVLIRGNLLIIAAADKERLKSLWEETMCLLKIEQITIKYNGDYLTGIES